jgi:hypothetical protein
MNTPLLSFHGKQEIKDAKIADLKRHKELDNLMQGDYWNGEKGCAVTCSMFTPEEFKTGNVDKKDIHGRYVTQIGVPRIIAYLEDQIFEGLPVAESKDWPLNFMQAIPVGVDLENVWRKFMIWLLVDDTAGVIKFANTENSRKAIRDVADAFTTSLTTPVPIETWSKLAAAAADAYAYADAYAADAYAYAYAADAYAYAADAYAYAADAYAYARAAADAYADAYARAAADAYADADDARKQHYIAMSIKLIELLKEAK